MFHSFTSSCEPVAVTFDLVLVFELLLLATDVALLLAVVMRRAAKTRSVEPVN